MNPFSALISDEEYEDLKAELEFEFKDTNSLPIELLTPITAIAHNERKWKSTYMGVWGFSYEMDKRIAQGAGNQIALLGLPAARLKCALYTPALLRSYLQDQDGEIHASQLIRLWALFEDFLLTYFESSNNIKPMTKREKFRTAWHSKKLQKLPFAKKLLKCWNASQKPEKLAPDFGNFKELSAYLARNDLADSPTITRLKLERETRNVFIHRRGRVGGEWLKAFRAAGYTSGLSIGDVMPPDFHRLESFHEDICRIVQNSISRF